MVKQLAILALLAVPAAKAAPPCYPWESSATNFEISTVPESKAQWLVAGDEASFTISWWCDVRYQWDFVGYMGWKKNLTPDWEAKVKSARGMTKAERDQFVDSLEKCKPNDPPNSPQCLQYAPLEPLMARQKLATTPDPIIWRVRDNPTATSRPVFPLSNGVRLTSAAGNERVSDVAQNCDCAKVAVEESGGTYCSVSGALNVFTTPVDDVLPDNRVALCTRIN